MVFSSLLFVFLFLALNLVSQAALRGARQKNIAMLLFSLVFFSWAGPRYVVLLLLDTALCWFFAICIEREPQRKKLHLSLCVALVLLVLGIFKYTGFLMGNLQSLFGWPEVIPQIVLPIGISFYTFQLISYVVDVYRGEVRAQKKYWILLLYASLFHQCIAGPIVRYRDVAQDLAKRQVHAEEVSRGISRFTVGLAKKAVLANSVAVLADRWLPMTTEGLAKIPTAGLWLGGLCYMLQIYLDFSAYSDMAIGMGLMCGFHYKENFNYPYIASSVTDFWRRWHISLSTFFRDYVYIPLGGNRRGKGRQLLNLFIVWGLTGLWHGASWNYVLWGLYFFLFLVIEKFLLGEKQQRIPAVLRHLFLLIIVYFCWVIFRFRDAAALGMALRGLFGGGTAAAGRGCRMGSDPSGSAAAVGGNGAGRGQLQSVPVFPVLRKEKPAGERRGAAPFGEAESRARSARSPSSGRAGCAPIPAVFADWRRCRDDLPAVCRDRPRLETGFLTSR